MWYRSSDKDITLIITTKLADSIIWVFCQLHMTPVSKHITIYLSDKPFHLGKAGSTHSFNYLASLHLTITVKLSVSL